MAFEWSRGLDAISWPEKVITVCVVLVVQLCVLLAFSVACRIGGDTIRHKNMPAARQAQALGLSYYAAGAFAWLPLAWPLMFLAFQLTLIYERVWYAATALAILGCVLFVFPGLLWIYDLTYYGSGIVKGLEGTVAVDNTSIQAIIDRVRAENWLQSVDRKFRLAVISV